MNNSFVRLFKYAFVNHFPSTLLLLGLTLSALIYNRRKRYKPTQANSVFSTLLAAMGNN